MPCIKSFLTTEQKHFIIVGVANTVLSYVLYSILLHFKFNYTLSYWIAMCAGVLNSYVFNKFWTFRAYRRSIAEFIRFVSVYLVSFFIGMWTLYCLVDVLTVNAYVAGIVNLFLTTLISWFGHKYFSFR